MDYWDTINGLAVINISLLIRTSVTDKLNKKEFLKDVHSTYPYGWFLGRSNDIVLEKFWKKKQDVLWTFASV